MAPSTFERVRFPAALVLLLVVGFVLWPRDGPEPTVGTSVPSPTVIVGVPGGEVIATEPPTPTPIPTATPAPTPAPTPTAVPPPPPDTFTAEVLVCRSIDGSTCNGQIDRLPPNVGAFTTLIRFTDANAGDTLNAVLAGPAGTLAGSPYALQGSGDGYFWAQFQAGSLPSGEYVVTATRNGEEVATTGFRKVGS